MSKAGIGFILAASALWSPSMASAEATDPYDILYELNNNAPRRGWEDGRAAWVNYARDRDRRFGWTLNIEYGVTPTGRVVNCTVWTSSGSDQFDNAVCAALTRKAKLEPVLNAQGKPIKSSGELSFQLRSSGWICGTTDELLDESGN